MSLTERGLEVHTRQTGAGRRSKRFGDAKLAVEVRWAHCSTAS